MSMEVVKTEQDERKIIEVEERAAALRKRKIELTREMGHWKQERDRLNESTRSKRAEALKHKEARDSANLTIVEIRRRMDSLREKMEEKTNILREFEERLYNSRRRLPDRPNVEEELRSIEWEMMTTPTVDISQREEILFEKARKLKKILITHEELDDLEDKRITMLAEIKAVELEIRESRDEVSRLKEISELNHENMILFFRRLDEERQKGDDAHNRFMELVSKVGAIGAELKVVTAEILTLRDKVAASEHNVEVKKKQVFEQRKMRVLNEVREKLEAGKKLSLKELKLLFDEEEKQKKS